MMQQFDSSGNPEQQRAAVQQMRDMLGPHAADQAARSLISMCWMLLPEGKKSVADLEREVRRLVERALKDAREDARTFGVNQE